MNAWIYRQIVADAWAADLLQRVDAVYPGWRGDSQWREAVIAIIRDYTDSDDKEVLEREVWRALDALVNYGFEWPQERASV